MTFAHKALAAAVFTVAAAGAQAQTQAPSKMYAEIGYAAIGLDFTDGANTLKSGPGALTGVLGYQLHPNVAVEGFLGLGIVKDEIEFNGTGIGINAKVNNTVGVFVKPGVKVTENVELFARLGYLRTKLTLSSGGVSVSDSDTGAAYGLGVNLNLTKTSYVQANWMSYYKEDGVKAQGVALAYGVRF
ncbi:outer membrane beta-barrel domain protein [Hydrogenophaga sp. RAC07]|uniref:outer membrane beta-barrel protein n=1 Tax=Hydrogenophaga sp. RAC07 TaxID=1842537 RepID=UPI00083CEB87|nr:outer membrane beta-barrel protein [Hydrogenophaga sp. RAC07]AOF87236.1 outer membrane beta-barrel domain protein [Hydrogenophaga sp. RAC07]